MKVYTLIVPLPPSHQQVVHVYWSSESMYLQSGHSTSCSESLISLSIFCRISDKSDIFIKCVYIPPGSVITAPPLNSISIRIPLGRFPFHGS